MPNPNGEIAINSEFDSLKRQPFDILACAADWMDDGMRTVFATGIILSTIHAANQVVITLRALGGYGFAWNYFDAVGGCVIAIHQANKARNATRHKKVKYTIAGVTFFSSVLLIVGTTLTILAATAVFVGTAAMATSPLGAITFAICMGVSAGIEAYLLGKAIMKCNMKYLLQDRLIKYQKLCKKISTLDDNTDGPEIKALQRKADSFKEQALSIARTRFRTREGKLDSSAHALLDIPELRDCRVLTKEMSLQPASDVDKAVLAFLKDKQYAKVRSHIFGLMTCALATVGMGLIAGGLFFPPLIIPGVVVATVAAALKLMQIFSIDKRLYNSIATKKVGISMDNCVANYFARRQRREQVYQSCAEQVTAIPSRINGKLLDRETRTKIYIAYELSKKSRDDYPTASSFAETLMQCSWWQRRAILKGAMDKHIETSALNKENNYTKGFSEEDRQKFADSLSKKDRQRLVAARLRKDFSVYRLRLFSSPRAERSVATSEVERMASTEPNLLRA